MNDNDFFTKFLLSIPMVIVLALVMWMNGKFRKALYRKHAEQNDAKAQYNLGLLYRDGQGMPQDWAEAYFWLDLAAAGKLRAMLAKDAAKQRDKASSHLTPADLSREQERARKWFEAHQAKPQ
ncbi:MAG TPA: SEL1-like repeat protein [Acidobacteriaceae bacterium]